MKAADLRQAKVLWAMLDDEGSRLARTALASQLRTTGLESTLRWLDTKKSKRLGEALCAVLGVPTARDARARRSNTEILADNRRALALAEALHLVARVHRD